MEKTGRKIICGAPTTFGAKGLMMMMNVPISHVTQARQSACVVLYQNNETYATRVPLGTTARLEMLSTCN